MSTTATTVDLDVKPEILTFAVIAEQVADGFEPDGTTARHKLEYRAASRDKDIAEAKAKNEVALEQSFSYDMPGTFKGILAVIPDEDEALQIFKAGYKTRLNSRIVAKLLEKDEQGNLAFQPVEGNYDFRAEIQEAAQRRNLSPTDKAAKALAGIPGITPEVIAALMAQIRDGMLAQTAPAAAE